MGRIPKPNCIEEAHPLKTLSWNVNHRAARHRIPAWVPAAIVAQSPDVVVLTEYVEGVDHSRFLAYLATYGLAYASITQRPPRQNQVLILSREPHRRGDLVAPAIHVAVPSNVLHVVLEHSGVNLLGIRVPAFVQERRLLKQQAFEWLLSAANHLVDYPSLIIGDFNTAPGDPATLGGGYLDQFSRSGWHHARPQTGCSWRHARSGTEREIDHAFVSPKLMADHAAYHWEFQQLGADAALGKVGCPDHAMLIVETDSP